VLCYQTRDANNNHCKYNDILFSVVFAAYYSLSSFNISDVLSSFDTTQCFDRRKYNMLMLKKTRYFDTDAIVAIIFFYHVIEFCAQERDHLLNE